MTQTTRGVSSRRGTVVAAYLLATACGYLLGARGLFVSSQAPADGPAQAVARVGYALGQTNPSAPVKAWDALGTDVATVRAGLAAPQRDVWDLIVAARGLENQGHPDWATAQARCQALGWPRCDRAAIEELQKRSRP